MTVTTYRGTTNANARGNTKDRAARRAWLLSTYAADVQLVLVAGLDGDWLALPPMPFRDGDPTLLPPIPAARCYRCGTLLHDAVNLPSLGIHIPATLTVDRIIPGCAGGTYRRTNIRPACGRDNSETGGHLGNARKASR